MNVSRASSENETHSTVEQINIAPAIIWGALLLTASIYVMAALIIHRIRSEKVKKKELLGASGSIKIKKTAGANRWLDNLSLIGSTFAVVNCASNAPIVFAGNAIAAKTCQVIQLVSYIFYASGHVTVYLFLWKRQRTCYKNPSLAQMLSKFSRVVSAAIMPVFISTNVAGVVLTFTVVVWSSDNCDQIGCISKKNHTSLIVLFVGSVVMQFTLLGLFIYPLRRHTNLLLERSAVSSTDRQLTMLVKRSIITTILLVLADATAFAVAMCLEETSLHSVYTSFVYDANLICNVVCVVGSFADWQRRLMPCCFSKVTNSRRYTASYKSSSATAAV